MLLVIVRDLITKLVELHTFFFAFAFVFPVLGHSKYRIRVSIGSRSWV